MIITPVATEIEVPELAAESCRLRGWRLSDVSALRPACGDAQICRFTTVPQRFSVTNAREWIARQHAHARNGTAIVLAIVPSAEDVPVGMVGLFGLDEQECTARFGYWLIADHRGHGLATAAAMCLAEWAFAHLQLSAVHIDHEPANHASARVAQKLGAVRAGSCRIQHRGAGIELIRHTLVAPGASASTHLA